MVILLTFLTFTCVVSVTSQIPDNYIGGILRAAATNNDLTRIRRNFKSEAPTGFCTANSNSQVPVSDTIELRKEPGDTQEGTTRQVRCFDVQSTADTNKIAITARVRITDTNTNVSDASQNFRYRIEGILNWSGEITVVPRPGSPPQWNISPGYSLDELPLDIYIGCPVFLNVNDNNDDVIRCYKFAEDSCTGDFCAPQNGNQFYVIYEECVLLLPKDSERTRVGISVEDTEDEMGMPVGGQSLLELPLNVQSGDSACKDVGSFSSANPSECHLVVPNETIKIIVYASTKVNGVPIGDSAFQCAVQTNPDELLAVTASEVADFDTTVIDTLDSNGKGSGSWQKFEIEIETSSGVNNALPLCCFFFFENSGQRQISEASCDITLLSDPGTSSLFTIQSWPETVTTPPSPLTKFAIDNFQIVLTLSDKVDSTQSNSAAAITFRDSSSQRWALSVDDITNGGSSLTVSNTDNDVTISLDQSKKDDIPLDIDLSVTIENGFFQRTVSTCTQYSEEFFLTSICFHFGDISPNISSLEFTFGSTSTLIFSFADLQYTVQNKDISALVNVEDDSGRQFFIESDKISHDSGTNKFVMDLPSNFSITQLKTIMDVELPTNLFCITQCTDEEVCNLAYPPMDQTFSVCYNQPVTVSSVNPSGKMLFTSFQNFLEIDFNYLIKKGMDNTGAKISDGSTDIITILAQNANFTNDKFYFVFTTTAVHDVQYSLIFDAGFGSTTTDTCDDVTLYSEPSTHSFCFYEQPSIDTSNITPLPASNILSSSVELSIGISGVQFGPMLEPGSSPVIVYKGDDITIPFQEIAFSGTPPLLTTSTLDEVIGRINLVANDYYTVVIPPSFVQVTDCSTPYPNTDTFTFTFCSIDLVLVRFEHFNLASKDEVTRFELTFINDIKIGLDDPYIVISSNIVKIFDNTEGNRYTIENNKATIILPSESKEDVRTHEVVFPAGLFRYKRDDLCVIPTKEIKKSFPEITAQVDFQSNAANTDTSTTPIPSENEASVEDIRRIVDVPNRIINSQTEPFIPNPQETVQQEQSEFVLLLPGQETVVEQRAFDQAMIGERRLYQERISGFPDINVRSSSARRNQVMGEVGTIEHTIQRPVDRRANSRRDFKRFGGEITETRQINRIFGREQQLINRIFGRARQINRAFE